MRLADVGISQLARQLHFTDHSPSHSGRLGENLTQGAFLSSLDDDQKRALAAIMANTPGLPAVFADRVRARLGDGEVAAGSPAVEPRQGQGAGAGAGRGSKREREGGEASVKGGGGGRKRGRK